MTVFWICRSEGDGEDDDDDDDDGDPSTKLQRERERRQANNARERYTIRQLLSLLYFVGSCKERELIKLCE